MALFVNVIFLLWFRYRHNSRRSEAIKSEVDKEVAKYLKISFNDDEYDTARPIKNQGEGKTNTPKEYEDNIWE